MKQSRQSSAVMAQSCRGTALMKAAKERYDHPRKHTNVSSLRKQYFATLVCRGGFERPKTGVRVSRNKFFNMYVSVPFPL